MIEKSYGQVFGIIRVNSRSFAVSQLKPLCAIEDKDVWQALIHEVTGHGQGLEVGRNVDLASFHSLAFEFFG